MITVSRLSKTFPARHQQVHAVRDFAVHVPEGKLLAVLGPSGCGKTTTLRMLAGLEQPDDGDIVMGGELVFSREQRIATPANRRPIGLVFQSYALWPHLNVLGNVAFPLRVAKPRPPRAEIRARAMAALDLVGVAGLARQPVSTLSGGQQQRVALARALVRRPRVLLLDEPLSNLDPQLRDHLRDAIRELQRSLDITTVYVTHDRAEALAISDLVLVMNQGRVVEGGDPMQVYRDPRSPFTAEFLGGANLLDGVVGEVLPDDLMRVETQAGTLSCRARDRFAAGDRVTVAIPPGALRLTDAAAGTTSWPATVQLAIFHGDQWIVTLEVKGLRLRAATSEPPGTGQPGQDVHVTLDERACLAL